jgi:formate--tetrahydrofolate ligase
VIVATVRALKSHGGVTDGPDLQKEDLPALELGAQNLAAHVDIVRAFGIPSVVAINRFSADTDEEVSLLCRLALEVGAEAVVVNDGFEKGGEGAVDLAQAVIDACDRPNSYAPLNPPGMSIKDQIERIATRLYGADGVEFQPAANRKLALLDQRGIGDLPVCMAKTHMSLSHDPAQKGRPTGYRLPIRDLLPSFGAGFVVALCGEIMLMPGLGRNPAFTRVDIDEHGRTTGLF